MNDTVYEIVFQSNMITKLDEIYDYIARMLSAPITVKKKLKKFEIIYLYWKCFLNLVLMQMRNLER